MNPDERNPQDSFTMTVVKVLVIYFKVVGIFQSGLSGGPKNQRTDIFHPLKKDTPDCSNLNCLTALLHQ